MWELGSPNPEQEAMLKNIKWSVREGSRHVDSGTVLAKDEREVLRRILVGDLGAVSPVPEKCYRISAGDALASAYGDEFELTCHAVGDPEGLPGEEHALTGGYLFDEDEVLARNPGLQGDHIPEAVILEAAKDFMENSRALDEVLARNPGQDVLDVREALS